MNASRPDLPPSNLSVPFHVRNSPAGHEESRDVNEAPRNCGPAAASPSNEVRPDGSNLIFILGVPRSGTSWLGKIFDSHPMALYRHEPDAVLPPVGFPPHCPVEAVPKYEDAARSYVALLAGVRQIKASGTRPVFAKPFQTLPAVLTRRALVYGLRTFEAIAPRARWPRRIAIPDWVQSDASSLKYVIKSVSLLGAAALLARALPAGRLIVIVRHPCGQIASMKRGLHFRTMRAETMFGPYVAETSRARELGFTRKDYENLPLLDQWVHGWAFAHAKMLKDVEGLANVSIVRYEELCASPLQRSREIIEFAGLPWDAAVLRFVEASTRPARHEGYFSLYREPMISANKWKEELSAQEIERYMTIVHAILPTLFPE